MTQRKHIKLYTDGACSGNPGPGGWGAILQWNGHERVLRGGESYTTNNRMELTAVIEGLAAIKEPCIVTVFTDSQYVIGIASLGWKRKANLDLLPDLDALCAAHEVTFEYVRGHAGNKMNERADALARAEVRRQQSASADYDICDRCYKRITGEELKRARLHSNHITFCDECWERNERA